jgi:hypothetical protein
VGLQELYSNLDKVRSPKDNNLRAIALRILAKPITSQSSCVTLVQIAHELRGRRYSETPETWLEQVGLGLTLWEGEFEGRQDVWLRWCYQDGNVLPTGDERAEQERLEKEQQQHRAEQAEQRAELLAAQLRALGIDPDTLT